MLTYYYIFDTCFDKTGKLYRPQFKFLLYLTHRSSIKQGNCYA